MKRTPLKRKTPMRRGPWGRESKPRKPLRRTPLAKESAKAKAKRPARSSCIAAVRARSKGRCEIRLTGCLGVMHHTHEIKPRSAGGSTTDPANCLGACFNCHNFVHHVNPNEARRRGFLKD